MATRSIKKKNGAKSDSYQNGDFKALVVYLNGEIWYGVREVFTSLGYAKNSPITQLTANSDVRDEERRTPPVNTPTGNRKRLLVNKQGLRSICENRPEEYIAAGIGYLTWVSGF